MHSKAVLGMSGNNWENEHGQNRNLQCVLVGSAFLKAASDAFTCLIGAAAEMRRMALAPLEGLCLFAHLGQAFDDDAEEGMH